MADKTKLKDKEAPEMTKEKALDVAGTFNSAK